jgi:CrcB protein
VTVAAAVALAAGAGAVLRHVVAVLVQRRTSGRLPWGTLAVNVSGSLLAGAVVGLDVGDAVRTVLLAGLAGGFTTLSTWAVEMRSLLAEGRRRAAAAYGAGTLVGCALAAGLGAGLARLS